MSSSAEDSGRDSGTLRAHNFLQPGYRRSQYISKRLLEPEMTHIIQRGFFLIDDYQLRATPLGMVSFSLGHAGMAPIQISVRTNSGRSSTDNFSRTLIRISEV
jgi:hypothetical protein